MGQRRHDNSPRDGLIFDETFGGLLEAFANHGMTREQFSRLEMPAGYSDSEVWYALSAIRKRQSVHYQDVTRLNGQS
jgi:hypothetical protein